MTTLPRPVIVRVNSQVQDQVFADNTIRTSKYTILTFLPMNLFEQFRKVSNFYFLLNMVISLIPGASPISPASSVVPLLFVVGVAVIKDGYEDWRRHVADNHANAIVAHVVRNKRLVDLPSSK